MSILEKKSHRYKLFIEQVTFKKLDFDDLILSIIEERKREVEKVAESKGILLQRKWLQDKVRIRDAIDESLKEYGVRSLTPLIILYRRVFAKHIFHSMNILFKPTNYCFRSSVSELMH